MYIDELDQLIGSVADLASMFNITSRRVQQFADDGKIPKAGHGQYLVADAVSFYCDYLRGADQSNDEKKLRARLLETKAHIAELQHAKDLNLVRDAEEMRRQDQLIAATLKNNLLSIADRIAPIAAAEADGKKVHAMIDTEIRRSLDAALEAMEKIHVDDDDLVDLPRLIARNNISEAKRIDAAND